MRAPTLQLPSFPGRIIAISGRLSVGGVAEVLEMLVREPRENPVQLDLREARVGAQALLALAHAVWGVRRAGLKIEGLRSSAQPAVRRGSAGGA